jgi:hypothetical protein
MPVSSSEAELKRAKRSVSQMNDSDDNYRKSYDKTGKPEVK